MNAIPYEQAAGVADAASSNGQPATGSLRFLTFSALRAATPEQPAWLWSGYLAAGAVTLLAGKPKAGKSTLACALIEASDAEAPSFLGRLIGGGPVVYVSEEGAGTLRPKLHETDRSLVLTRDAAWPKPPWPTLIEAAVTEAKRIGGVLLVIDALSFWANFGPDQEKDAGAAQRAMNALTRATRAGLAVLLVHHQRKSGGEDGDAVRGSGAIFGAVDALIEIERLLRAVPGDEPGATTSDLEAALGSDKRKWFSVLDGLVTRGLARRFGEGKKGDPYRYQNAVQGFCPEPGQHFPEMLSPPRRGTASNMGSVPDAVPGQNRNADDDLIQRAEVLAARHADLGEPAS